MQNTNKLCLSATCLVVFFFCNVVHQVANAQQNNNVELRLIHDGPVCDSGDMIVNGNKVGSFLMRDSSVLFETNTVYQFTGEKTEFVDKTTDAVFNRKQWLVSLNAKSFLSSYDLNFIFLNKWSASYGLSPRNLSVKQEWGDSNILVGSYLHGADCTVDSWNSGDTNDTLDRPLKWSNSFDLFSNAMGQRGSFKGSIYITKSIKGASYTGKNRLLLASTLNKQFYFPAKNEEVFLANDDQENRCMDATTLQISKNKKYKLLRLNQCDSWNLSGAGEIEDGGKKKLDGLYIRAYSNIDSTIFLSHEKAGSLLGIPMPRALKMIGGITKPSVKLFYRNFSRDDWVELDDLKINVN